MFEVINYSTSGWSLYFLQSPMSLVARGYIAQTTSIMLAADGKWHGWTIQVGTGQWCLAKTCGWLLWPTATDQREKDQWTPRWNCYTLYSGSWKIIYTVPKHTHTRLTALFPGLPRWAGTRKVKPIILKQETVSGSGISWAVCKTAACSRQTTTPAPHHSVFYRPDALPAAQPIATKHTAAVQQQASQIQNE